MSIGKFIAIYVKYDPICREFFLCLGALAPGKLSVFWCSSCLEVHFLLFWSQPLLSATLAIMGVAPVAHSATIFDNYTNLRFQKFLHLMIKPSIPSLFCS